MCATNIRLVFWELSICSWSSTQSTCLQKASVSKTYCPSDLCNGNTGGVLSFFCIYAIECSSSSLKVSSFVGCPLRRSWFTGADTRAKFGTNLRNTLQTPKKDHSSITFVGGLNCSMASFVCGEICRDPGLISCLR